MKCPNTWRTIRRDQEEIQIEDKVQNGRILDLVVGIHRPHRKTPRIKEVVGPMKYQLAQIVKRSIGASVA